MKIDVAYLFTEIRYGDCGNTAVVKFRSNSFIIWFFVIKILK